MDIIISAEFNLKNARDTRCRGWAKLIRSADVLRTTPAECAAEIEQNYLTGFGGDITLYPGDAVIFTEENHHRKQRGRFAALYFCDENGEIIKIFDRVERKNKIKGFLLSKGVDKQEFKDIMGGSGPCAAVYRYLIAIRAGLNVHELQNA